MLEDFNKLFPDLKLKECSKCKDIKMVTNFDVDDLCLNCHHRPKGEKDETK